VSALAGLMADCGGVYATHMRDENIGVLDSLEETFETARRARVPVVISHHKCAGPDNWGRSTETLAAIEEARAGQPVALDAYPYAAGSTVLLPRFMDSRIRIRVSWSKPHPEMAGRDLADIAAEWGCSQEQAAVRLDPAGAVYFQMEEADVRRILAYPHTMIGSDGLPHDAHPHPRLWGTFPRVIGHYGRDEGLFGLEEAVRRMTGLPAEKFRLSGRGVLARGAVADLVVFDPATIADRATYDEPTLPAAGIDMVFVNGCLSYRDGAPTADRAGRLLRRDG
jgi:N-acyl-D-amino-acid deacylase